MSDAAVTPKHLSEAADWHLRLSSAAASDADRQGWQRWYEDAAEHRQAWDRVERLKHLLAQTPARARQTLSLMPARMERMDCGDLTERTEGMEPADRSDTLARASQHQPRKRDRRRALTGLGALGAVVMGGFFYRAWTRETSSVEWIVTGAGQRREWTLPDGGHLLLGPESRLGIDYSASRRMLHLSQGAMQLQTGTDPHHRPLTVRTRDGDVTPLGTRLTLVQEDTASVVAVQTHAVLVLPTGTQVPVRVDTGQRLRFFKGGHDAAGPAGFADVAWTRGVLVAMDQPLSQVLQRLSVQSGMPLSCDASIAGLRISGSFLTADPQRSLATVADQWGLRLERQGQGLVLRPR